jgi:hypothetical protein
LAEQNFYSQLSSSPILAYTNAFLPSSLELWGHREAFIYMERNAFRLFLGLRACQEADSSQARSKKPRRSRKNVPYLRCKDFFKI